MRIKDYIYGEILLFLAITGLTACEPISPEDKAFFAEQDRLRGEKMIAMRAANVGVSIEDVINHVKRYPAQEGSQTMESWVLEEIFEMGGQMLFPQWDANRSGSNIQKVTFEFILLNDEGQMKRYKYSWDVDVLDMTVKEPEIEELEEIESPEMMLKNQHLRRVQKHEQDLK